MWWPAHPPWLGAFYLLACSLIGTDEAASTDLVSKRRYKYCNLAQKFYKVSMQILSTNLEKIEGIADADFVCKECQVKPAEIFQVNGEYCLECWQDITHTNPQPAKSRQTYSPAKKLGT